MHDQASAQGGAGAAAGPVRVLSAEQMHAGMLLGVSASLKPAPGKTGRSAARGLLVHVLTTVGRVSPHVALLDLRDHPMPLFDGRLPSEYDSPEVATVRESIGRAGALLLSVPAYWGGVSGVFKNLIDVVCGPSYDIPQSEGTAFTGKPVGLVVVGADEASAPAGASQAASIVDAIGARLVAPPVVVANPRSKESSTPNAAGDLVALAAELAAAARL